MMIFVYILLLAEVILSAEGFHRTYSPGDFAFESEDDFEDALDRWLADEEQKWMREREAANPMFRAGKYYREECTGCTIRVNGDLGQPQPLYIHTGYEDVLIPANATGEIHIHYDDELELACTGSGRTLVHPRQISTPSIARVRCAGNSLVVGDWLDGLSEFGAITCSSHAYHETWATGNTCYGGNTEIAIGFIVNDRPYIKFHSCFDQSRLEVLYVSYEQNAPNAVHQTGVDRPSWLVSSWFPGVGINSRYTQAQQLIKLTELVGEELANKYQTNLQYLARGHLAAKTDYIYASGQRATFYFINAAPQWQPFNAGNWNWLEQNLRARIGALNTNTKIWTGTYGVSQMRNASGHLLDYYLYHDANNNQQLPVPKYYWKVVYDEVRKLGTAFISINNPYYTEDECKEYTFCTDICRNNPDFDWIGWAIDRIDIGYSFCCEIYDFRRTVPYLPEFEVNGIFS